MSTPAPDSVKRLVDHFDQNRKVFQSPDYKEEQLTKANTPREQESIQRQIATTDKAFDARVYELYGLTDEEIRIVGGEARTMS
jgi:ClpP class serine protease